MITLLGKICDKLGISASFLNRHNSPSLKVHNEAKIEQVTINKGLSYSEAKDLIVSVVDQRLGSFKNEAKEIFKERTEEFKMLLYAKIKDLPQEEMAKLREPDTQIALLEAANISGRKQNNELRNLLANLVVNRIKNDKTGKEELKNIVYNEAITTVSKLTIDQLKIITLCYLSKYTTYGGIVSWDTFQKYLNTHIKPFVSFKNTNAEFQHIEYAGCGSIGISSWNLVDIYRQQYSFLFFNLIEKPKIDDLILPETIKGEILRLDQTEDKYFVRVRNKSDLEKFFKDKELEQESLTKFLSLYDQSIKNTNDVREKIQKETDIGKALIDIWEKSNISHLSLTSVGIAIGACYFEQIVGEKINIDIWIN
ncbi:MAG: hypothetical protein UV70_C0022G0004 [Parcubacteria group bacterium GW2011_GWA2_43_13]|nr:MAG: hypothetical protein UV70_C0022G0004 [Parcubacteria group bacterium GW2011_GWA2_43_13]